MAEKRSKQALAGSRKSIFHMDPNDLEVVGVDTDDGEEHPLYDERAKLPLDDAMVRNIMHFGVLEPVLVRKDGDTPQVVAGRRRVLHAREANKRLHKLGSKLVSVPVLNKRGKDREMLGIMVSENEIRREDTVLSRARKVNRFMEMGADENEASDVFGVSTQTISAWLSLLDCDDKVIEAVESNRISATAASKLSKLKRTEQRAKLAKMLVNGKATVKRAGAEARAARGGQGPQVDGGGEEEVAHVAPTKRRIRKALAASEASEAPLDPMVVKTLKWALGDTGAQTIKGLTKLLQQVDDEASATREKRRKRKAPEQRRPQAPRRQS